MEHESDPMVERDVALDAPAEEVWAALVDTEGWLCDAGTLDLRAGAESSLTDDGVRRRAVVDVVDAGRRLVYRWWGDDEGPSAATRVEITLVPGAGATRVTVRETPLRATASIAPPAASRAASRARRALWWEVRLTCLAFAAVPARALV